jgi:hypothetical protein
MLLRGDSVDRPTPLGRDEVVGSAVPQTRAGRRWSLVGIGREEWRSQVGKGRGRLQAGEERDRRASAVADGRRLGEGRSAGPAGCWPALLGRQQRPPHPLTGSSSQTGSSRLRAPRISHLDPRRTLDRSLAVCGAHLSTRAPRVSTLARRPRSLARAPTGQPLFQATFSGAGSLIGPSTYVPPRQGWLQRTTQ